MIAIPCRALLFDCDGVLVDSDASVLNSWTRWAQERGLDAALVSEMAHGRRSADTVALLVEPEDQEQGSDDIDRYELEGADTVTAVPGAVELVASLPDGIWAVVTSGRRPLATARLAAAGLPKPEVLICADDVPVGKPDPAGYLAAAAALAASPDQCLVLEDSASGVAAGLASGAAVLGVGERALDSAAEVVARDLRGLRWDGGRLFVPPENLLRGGNASRT